MSGESWVIHNDQSKKAFIKHFSNLMEKHKRVTYPAPRLGSARVITQNSLFHVWIKEYAKHAFNKTDVSAGEIDGMKRIIKMWFYNAHPGSYWMIYELVNPITKEVRRDYTSSSSYNSGEMYMMLEFIQNHAANNNLILESKGRFLKLQQKAEGV